MTLGNLGVRTRGLLVWSATSVALGLTTWAAVPPATAAARALTGGGLPRVPLDVVLTDLAASALLGCAVWMWLCTTAVVLEALRGSTGGGRAGRLVPAGVRRALLAACGIALVGGLAQPSYAAATPPAPGHRSAPAQPDAARLAGLPLPDRAVAPRGRDRADETAPPEPTVVVRVGDTLWSIAVRGLPAGSTDERIGVRWRAIYDANRSLIGRDPDLIVPGQRLVVPGEEPR